MTTPPETPAPMRWLPTDRVLLIGLAGVAVWIVGHVLLLIFAAILLAVELDGVTRIITTRSTLPRGWALALATLLVLGGTAALTAAVAPQIIAESGQLLELAAGAVEFAQRQAQQLGFDDGFMDGEGGGQLFDVAGAFAGRMANFTVSLISGAGSLVLLIIIGVFAAADPGLYRRGLLALFPPERRGRIDATLSHTAHALRWWFLGQLASMAVLGITVGLGLMVIGIDLWLSLAALTALLTFIPVLGPFIAGIPIVAIGFASGIETGLIVTAFFLAVQILEGNILVPMIQHRAVKLPPALLLAAEVLLGVLFGLVGLVLAAPLTVVAMVAVQRLYVQGVLGEEP